MSNAVKYGGRATIAVEDGADLVLRVLDEGPGIPEDSLDQVFEPFFRLESSRNSATGGTGLGLGIARDIAQAQRLARVAQPLAARPRGDPHATEDAAALMRRATVCTSAFMVRQLDSAKVTP